MECDEQQTPDERPLVAIVGAGLGGLAAAAALQRWGARVRVYERDASFDVRKQGYGLTMQQGGAALRALGAEELGARCLAASLHVSFASDGTVLGRYGRDARREQGRGDGDERASPQPKKAKTGGGGARNFLIPRQHLRQELLDMLEPGSVRWGCNFESYRAPGGGGEGVTLGFAPNASGEREAEAEAALLVGADGVFSRVAKQRLAAEHTALEYTGVLVVLGITPLGGPGAELRAHPLLQGCNTVTETVDSAHRARLYTMPFSSTHHMWQLSVPLPLAEADALRAAGPVALLREALRICDGWHEPLPALLRATASDDVTGYPVYDRTPLPAEALRPVRAGRAVDTAVTLLGDAVHPMAPFKGQGANQALLDGVELAQELQRSVLGQRTARALARRRGGAEGQDGAQPEPERSVEQALCSFEAGALRRSAIKVETSRRATRELHDCPQASRRFIAARMDPCSAVASESKAPGGQQRQGRASRRARRRMSGGDLVAQQQAALLQCLHYPRVGQRVQVLSERRTSAYDAVVFAAPGEELGVWRVRAVRPGGEVVGEAKAVHFSRLAANWGLGKA